MSYRTIALAYTVMFWFLLLFNTYVVAPKLALLREYEKANCVPPASHGY